MWLVGAGLCFSACGGSPEPKAPAAVEPAPAAAPPPAAPEALLPTNSELRVALQRATRIEAKSTRGQTPRWSKDLTPEDVATLIAGIGEAKVGEGVPRCLPTIRATAYAGDEVIAGIGAFCGDAKGPIRVDVGGVSGSLVPADGAKVAEALASPVDL
jgi:hypothetical protein